MYYSKVPYNMLCYANGQSANTDQSCFVPFPRQTVASASFDRLIWQRQTQALHDLLINQQQTAVKTNFRYNLTLSNYRYFNESQQSNQISTLELERFQKMLQNAGVKSTTQNSQRKLSDFDELQTVTRPNSPVSDISSGFGTMPSPISDLDSPPILTPPVKTQIIEDNLVQEAAQTKDTIMYQGRDLLDLHTNMTYQWSFQMAVLPPHNLKTHFEYRSLYHRLGAYGMVDELATCPCPDCGFENVVPKYQ